MLDGNQISVKSLTSSALASQALRTQGVAIRMLPLRLLPAGDKDKEAQRWSARLRLCLARWSASQGGCGPNELKVLFEAALAADKQWDKPNFQFARWANQARRFMAVGVLQHHQCAITEAGSFSVASFHYIHPINLPAEVACCSYRYLDRLYQDARKRQTALAAKASGQAGRNADRFVVCDHQYSSLLGKWLLARETSTSM